MKATAVDRAYEWLRERIFDGTFPGGSFIDEASVVHGAEVSRTPAREALNRLEGERYIRLVPRRGAQVRKLDLEDLRDAFGARLMIESHAASELCAMRHPLPVRMDEELAHMKELSEHDVAQDLSVWLEFQAADQAFHGALVDTMGNKAISDFYHSLWRVNLWSMMNRSKRIMSQSLLERIGREHRDIAEALRRHDADNARSVLKMHLHFSLTEANSPLE